jgi:hypothetical protein
MCIPTSAGESSDNDAFGRILKGINVEAWKRLSYDPDRNRGGRCDLGACWPVCSQLYLRTQVGTRLQLFALPVSRPIISLSKALCSLTYGWGLLILVISSYLICSGPENQVSDTPTNREALAFAIVGYFCYSVLIGGVLLLYQSIRETILPFSGLVAAGAAGIGIVLYWSSHEWIIAWLGFLGRWEQVRRAPKANVTYGYTDPEIALVVYPVVAGLFLMLLGSYFLHRYSDT